MRSWPSKKRWVVRSFTKVGQLNTHAYRGRRRAADAIENEILGYTSALGLDPMNELVPTIRIGITLKYLLLELR